MTSDEIDTQGDLPKGGVCVYKVIFKNWKRYGIFKEMQK